jgi:murein L,D-transpeptidase YafK
LQVSRLTGCNGTLEEIAPTTTAGPRPPSRCPNKLVQSDAPQGHVDAQSPIMLRIFKEEAKLEVWKQKDSGRYDLATSYDICKWSGRARAEVHRRRPAGAGRVLHGRDRTR